jgi:hypothetical protein
LAHGTHAARENILMFRKTCVNAFLFVLNSINLIEILYKDCLLNIPCRFSLHSALHVINNISQVVWLHLGFEVLTAVVIKGAIFWDMTPCSPLKINRRFGGTYYLHLQNSACRLLSR